MWIALYISNSRADREEEMTGAALISVCQGQAGHSASHRHYTDRYVGGYIIGSPRLLSVCSWLQARGWDVLIFQWVFVRSDAALSLRVIYYLSPPAAELRLRGCCQQPALVGGARQGGMPSNNGRYAATLTSQADSKDTK